MPHRIKAAAGAPRGMEHSRVGLLGSGDLEGALEKFLKAIACSESFYAGHANAGLVLQELGRMEDASQHLLRAEELSLGLPADSTRPAPPPTQRQGWEDIPLGFEEVACLGPSAAAVEHDAGDSLRLLGRTEEAHPVHEGHPPRAGTRYFLPPHWDHAALDGNLAEALPWYKLAIGMEPDNAVFWEELADIYQKREELDKAVTCWRRVLELSPTTETRVLIELGSALQQDGRPEEALEQFLAARGGCTVSRRSRHTSSFKPHSDHLEERGLPRCSSPESCPAPLLTISSPRRMALRRGP